MKILASLIAGLMLVSVPFTASAQNYHQQARPTPYEYRHNSGKTESFVTGVIGGLVIGSIISEQKRYEEPRYRYDYDYRYDTRRRRDYDYGFYERCFLTPYYDNYGRKVFVRECSPGR